MPTTLLPPTGGPPRRTARARTRHTLRYWVDRLTLAARRFQKGFTRENIVANLKTLLWVVPLTALIWIYAERQQLVTQGNISVHITVKSADPSHLVALLVPREGMVTVTLQGSQSGIEKVRELAQKTMAQPLAIEVSSSLPPSRNAQTLVTLDQLAGNRMFESQGVKLTACSPETLLVQVDKLDERTAPVQPPPDVPGLVGADFIPAAVKLRGPSQLLEDLEAHHQLTAMADLATNPVLKQPGEHDIPAVKLMSPSPELTVAPDAVMAHVRVREADESMDVNAVPVFVLAPKFLIDDYRIAYNAVLDQPVTVVGPPAQIAQFKGPKKPNLVAVLTVGTNDVGFKGAKPITFLGLPDGVKVKPTTPERTVQVEVSAR